MDGFVTVFILCLNKKIAENNADQFKDIKFVKSTFIVTGISDSKQSPGYNYLQSKSICNCGVFRKIYDECNTEFILLLIDDREINIDEKSLIRTIEVARKKFAGLVYSDYHEVLDSSTVNHPTIDYQTGSIRDDFEFGPVILLNKDSITK